MSYPVAEISIAMFTVFLGASTWYLTGDVLPAFIGVIAATLMVLSYLYFYTFNRFRLMVNVNPARQEPQPVVKKRKK
jgi:hypothetical protein